MPLQQRKIESNFSYINQEIIDKSPRETVIKDSIFASKVGTIAQFSMLASYAHEIFSNIIEETLRTKSRIDEMSSRAKSIEVLINTKNFSVNHKLIEFHEDNYRIHQNSSMAMRLHPEKISYILTQRYQEIYPPPALNDLDTFMTAKQLEKSGPSLSGFSDPSFFFRVWLKEQQKQFDAAKEEKAARKAEKKNRKMKALNERKSLHERMMSASENRASKRRVSWRERFSIDEKDSQIGNTKRPSVVSIVKSNFQGIKTRKSEVGSGFASLPEDSMLGKFNPSETNWDVRSVASDMSMMTSKKPELTHVKSIKISRTDEDSDDDDEEEPEPEPEEPILDDDSDNDDVKISANSELDQKRVSVRPQGGRRSSVRLSAVTFNPNDDISTIIGLTSVEDKPLISPTGLNAPPPPPPPSKSTATETKPPPPPPPKSSIPPPPPPKTSIVGSITSVFKGNTNQPVEADADKENEDDGLRPPSWRTATVTPGSRASMRMRLDLAQVSKHIAEDESARDPENAGGVIATKRLKPTVATDDVRMSMRHVYPKSNISSPPATVNFLGRKETHSRLTDLEESSEATRHTSESDDNFKSSRGNFTSSIFGPGLSSFGTPGSDRKSVRVDRSAVSSLLGDITTGIALKKAEAAPPAQTRASFLGDITGGVKLKKASDRPLSEDTKGGNMGAFEGSAVMSILARRKYLQDDSDSESDEDMDEDKWT